MQIEFEYLPEPMPLDDSVLDFLLKKARTENSLHIASSSFPKI